MQRPISELRRKSAPAALALPVSQPVSVDFLPEKQKSLFTELWEQHRCSQLVDGKTFAQDGPSLAKDTDDYKRAELGFRVWLLSQVTVKPSELDYKGIQELTLTALNSYTQEIISAGTTVPTEVLALLDSAIKGREAVRDTYFRHLEATDVDVVGHQHHINELQRFHSQLSAPPRARPSLEEIWSSSWRK